MAKQYTAVLFDGVVDFSGQISNIIDVSGYKKYLIEVYSANPNGLCSVRLASTTAATLNSPFIEDATASFSAGAYVPAFQLVSNLTQIPLASKYMQLVLAKTSGTNGRVVVIGTFQE